MRAAQARPWWLGCALGAALFMGCERSATTTEPERTAASNPPGARSRAVDAGASRAEPVETAELPSRAPPPVRAGAPRAPAEPGAQGDTKGRERGAKVEALAGAVDATAVEGSARGPWIIDGLVDVGPAGPASATEHGVALVDRENRLWLSPWRGGADALGPRPTPLLGLPDGAGPFALAPGPSVFRGYAYWVARGRLFRQALTAKGPGRELEVLAEDARSGTRVAVPDGSAGPLRALGGVAAYIARPSGPEEPPSAKLWIEGRGETLRVSDSTASAHSVALVSSRDGLAALFLEARTGMSSIHRRMLRVSRPTDPVLDEDRVVWVGGPSRSTTQLMAHGRGGDGALAVLALERDMTHFGLLRLPISLEPEPAEARESEWLLYDNGIEPAPFASTLSCGERVLAFARPSSAEPRAPQELVLARTDRARPEDVTVVARARAFYDLSLAALPNGALLVYVADHRTWARRLRCAR